jgi:hypothetical protein
MRSLLHYFNVIFSPRRALETSRRPFSSSSPVPSLFLCAAALGWPCTSFLLFSSRHGSPGPSLPPPTLLRCSERISSKPFVSRLSLCHSLAYESPTAQQDSYSRKDTHSSRPLCCTRAASQACPAWQHRARVQVPRSSMVRSVEAFCCCDHFLGPVSNPQRLWYKGVVSFPHCPISPACFGSSFTTAY